MISPVIKCVVVDDEFLALELLEKFISEEPDLELTGKCRSAAQAMELLRAHTVDLLFLDIQMPDMSGIHLLKNIPQMPVTIFTTAYPRYAHEAFNLDAADYLTKPFSQNRFRKAVDKARNALKILQMNKLDLFPTGDITVKSDRKLVKIAFSDIHLVEGWKEYVKIHTSTDVIITLESMANMEELLPGDHFCRVHKSFIVCIPRVNQLDGDVLIMRDKRIPVARTRKKEVVRRIFGAI